MTQQNSKKIEALTVHTLLLGVLILGVYGLTLYRTVPGGDSGEFIQVASQWGVAHPPGYPLYTLLAKLFSLFPVGSIATRINFLSALCDALAAMGLCWTVGKWTGKWASGVVVGGWFAFSSIVWETAIAAEVFALNNLFLSGLVYALYRFQNADSLELRKKIGLYSLFWVSLALSNHHTFVFFGFPALAFILFSKQGEVFRALPLSKIALSFGAGLLPYLYLPLADLHPQTDSWGNTSTLSGFLIHLLRREYGTFSLAADGLGGKADSWSWISYYLMTVLKDMQYLGLPVLLYGLYSAAKRFTWVRVLVGSYCLALIVLFSLSNIDIEVPLYRGVQMRFWQQLHLVSFIGMGWGLSLKWARSLAPVAWGLVAVPLLLNFSALNRSHDEVFRAFAHQSLDSLPPQAILLTSGDHVTHTLLYFQQKEGLRPDVHIVDHVQMVRNWYVDRVKKEFPDLVFPGAYLGNVKDPQAFQLKQFFDANLKKYPLFFVNRVRVQDESYVKDYRSWPMGFLEQILPIGTGLDYLSWVQRDQQIRNTWDIHPLEAYPLETWEHEVLRQYWLARHTFAVALIHDAPNRAGDRRPLDLAVATLEEITHYPEFATASVYKNLGAAYQALSGIDPSAKQKMKDTWHHYLQIAPSSDADLQLILKAITTS